MTTKYIPLVDAENQVIGKTTLADAESKGYKRQIARVFVFDTDQNILVQKHSAASEIDPGVWSEGVCGYVEYGETYYDAARRALEDQLGLSNVNLLKVACSHQSEDSFDGIFKIIISAESISVQNSTVEAVRWCTVSELEQLLVDTESQCAPGFSFAWRTYRDVILNAKEPTDNVH